jgi:hypothetical protein
MPGARASKDIRGRARLLSCVLLALGAHAVLLASGATGKKLVVSGRSAGALQEIALEQRPAEVPGHAAILPVVRPAARADHGTAGRPARVVIGSDGAERWTFPYDATNSVVARAARIETASGGDPAIAQGHSTGGSVNPLHGIERSRLHGPRLLTAGACRRFFPSQAHDDDGAVVLALNVHETGTAFAARIVSETPMRQGFGGAALRCASLLKFEPAANVAGAHVASISVVRLRFARALVE